MSKAKTPRIGRPVEVKAGKDLTVRFPGALYKRLSAAAKRNGHSIAAEVRARLTASF